MTLQSTNFYGYDKATYDDCRDLIDETNRRHLNILNVWFLIINLLCTIFANFGIFSANLSDKGLYLSYTFISIAFFISSHTLQRIKKKKSLVLHLHILLNVFIWMIYSIQLSVDQPYMAATMYIVMIVVLSFSFITTLFTTLLLLIISAALFIFSSYREKTAAIAGQDLYNVLIFVTLAIILHFAFQRTRLQQFVTLQKNIQIQRELEIKSSFDALTSLLNRGRFFSLAGNVLENPHNEYIVICLLDLDEFKEINDKLGHQMGDKAIQVAGSTIIETLGIDMTQKWEFQNRVLSEKGSFPGRLGGDEFIVMIRGASGREAVMDLLQNMLSSLNSVEIGDLHGIHASMGFTEITAEDHDIDVAYKRADEALYESKRAGKNQIRFREAVSGGGNA